MSLAVVREQVVGPGVPAFARATCSASGGSGRRGGAIPIRGRIGNSPHISVVVERHADEKEFSVIAQRQASRYAGRNFSAAWQIVQQYWSFERQGLRRAKSAALRAYDKRDALRREGMLPVQAGHGHGNFNAHSRAAPYRLGCEDFHKR